MSRFRVSFLSEKYCHLTFPSLESIHSSVEGGEGNANEFATSNREPETSSRRKTVDYRATCSPYRNSSKKHSLLRKHWFASLSRTSCEWLPSLQSGRRESFDATTSSSLARRPACRAWPIVKRYS